ncbi:MAG: cation transporter [Bacteroidales bacterium]|nr:cation transporter [Bacteroidales bacterium]
MAHHHDHDHHHINAGGLFLSVLLNIIITVGQIIGGLISGSMALLSDALHNFSDVLSLLITYFAHKLSHRKHTVKHTFGYQRAEILAAFINSAMLIGIAVFLGVEAVNRIIAPEAIKSSIVIWLAAGSIVINGLSVLLVHSGSKNSINIRSAYLHLLSDMLTSVAVLVGGFLMKYYSIYWVDGIITLVIAVYLIYSSWHLFVESINIIMLFSPKEINIKELKHKIEAIEGIKNIHHLHLWRLTDNHINMEAHVDLEKDIPTSAFEICLEKIQKTAQELGIHHVTIQPEFSVSDSKELIHNH